MTNKTSSCKEKKILGHLVYLLGSKAKPNDYQRILYDYIKFISFYFSLCSHKLPQQRDPPNFKLQFAQSELPSTCTILPKLPRAPATASHSTNYGSNLGGARLALRSSHFITIHAVTNNYEQSIFALNEIHSEQKKMWLHHVALAFFKF